MGSKNVNLKQRRASHFSVFVCQNWMKNGKVMTMRSARAKVGLAYFGPKGGHFGPKGGLFGHIF